MIAPVSSVTLARYNRRLHRRHPMVRVRWSHVRGAFVLEERVYRAREIDPRLFRTDAVDLFVQQRDGYMTIEFMRQLPPVSRLADALEASRITHLMERSGAANASDLADKMDAEYDARVEREREQFKDMVGEVASDEYDRAQWRTGSRASVPRGV